MKVEANHTFEKSIFERRKDKEWLMCYHTRKIDGSAKYFQPHKKEPVSST